MIAISDLSVMPLLSRGRTIMVVLKGYFDDSGDDIDPKHRVCAVAGYVATNENWKKLEDSWPVVLEKFGVPFLHMKEFGNPSPDGEYAHLSGDKEKTIEFLAEITALIKKCELRGFGSAVRIADLKRFNEEENLNIGAYPLALYGAILEFFRAFPDVMSEIVVDHLAKAESKITTAK
jgi:hypothetical protein